MQHIAITATQDLDIRAENINYIALPGTENIDTETQFATSITPRADGKSSYFASLYNRDGNKVMSMGWSSDLIEGIKDIIGGAESLFNDLINIFADNKVEEIPLPKTDNCQDDADETRDVKDEDPTKKAKEEFIKALREELEKQFGKEEAARLARIGMHRASKLIGSLESLDPKNYVVDGDKIIIALPKKGVIKAGAGQAYEVAFDIISSEAAKQAGKGVVKVGKYFVRVNPYVLATLTAYEIGSYIYENREDIALKLGEVTEFARKMVDNARDTSRQKTKQDLAGNYGSPNPDPDDWEPDDQSHSKSENKERISQVLDEIQNAKEESFTSKIKLNQNEALQAGKEWLGEGYKEIGQPNSGVYRSKDGLRQFRIDRNSIEGKHNPYESHVHLEKFDSMGNKISNSHIIFGK